MITLTRPRWNDIRKYLDDRQGRSLTYGSEFRRFQCDQAAVRLGHGRQVFGAACRAARQWRMFPREMVEVFWPDPELSPGHVVAVLFRGPGFWSLNPCRILDHVDEERHFGFTYGTLDGHLECGQESFMIHWRDDDSVWYELMAYSRPHHWLAWIGYPIVRREQARFRRLSCQSVLAATKELVAKHAKSFGHGSTASETVESPGDFRYLERKK